jgi:hypothetical protein
MLLLFQRQRVADKDRSGNVQEGELHIRDVGSKALGREELAACGVVQLHLPEHSIQHVTGVASIAMVTSPRIFGNVRSRRARSGG